MRFACRALFLLTFPALAGCGVPQLITPYRMEIQQGNYISQEMVSQLKPGMTREQVRYVLGTPLVQDIFHADRWDYVYYRDVQSGVREARKISVLFKDGKLLRIAGDVVPAAEGGGAGGAQTRPVSTPGVVPGAPLPEAKQ